MASLPARTNQPVLLSDQSIDSLIERLSRGEHPNEIAKKAHPNDKLARQRTRRRLYKAILSDQRVAERIAQRARLELMVGLIPATKALSRRAGRGNVPAMKLAFESSGFHNPRIQHEHSGEVRIVMDMPRPTFHAEATADEIPAEAEAVD